MRHVRRQYSELALSGIHFARDWLELSSRYTEAGPPRLYCGPNGERQRVLCSLEAVAAKATGVSSADLRHILADCDYPLGETRVRPAKGFWRVDKGKPPELRQTVLALIALCHLEALGKRNGGENAGIQAFLYQNHGEGWLLPETLRLADYGLGRDERAKQPQPVASRLGPRFYDWQLSQSPADAWRECRLHARNLLGPEEYAEFAADAPSRQPLMKAAEPRAEYRSDLFGTDDPS